MNKIVVMGECMVEFGSTNTENVYKQSFAGDVFNTGIYIKRCVQANADVSFLSVIGNDEISNKMIDMMHQEQLDTNMLYHSPTEKMGLYIINLDDEGERSFTYWRDNSAATKLIQFMEADCGVENLKGIDTFFFSGISIAILSADDLIILWRYIAQLKSNGTTIVFDPNYRPLLWHSIEITRSAFNIAFTLSDIVLPGVDDHIALYGAKTAEDVADYLETLCVKEIVIKNGSEGMLISVYGERTYIDVEPVEKVVDTTSAGDAFNGGYLSARLMNKSVISSAKFAANVASCVIQHKGAIVSKRVFTDHLNKLPL